MLSNYIQLAFLLLITGSVPNFSCKSNNSNIDNNKYATLSGKVIGIVDGDTYDILLNGNKTQRIRVDAIDAPEKGMPYYKASKQYLSDLCFGKSVRLLYNTTDQHDRFVCRTILPDNRDVSVEMIKAGLAWHYKQYSKDTLLANLEIRARSAQLGLWKDAKPFEPWYIRKLHKQGISTKDSFK